MKEVPILKDLKTYINRYRKDRVVELGIGKYVCRVIWVEYPVNLVDSLFMIRVIRSLRMNYG